MGGRVGPEEVRGGRVVRVPISHGRMADRGPQEGGGQTFGGRAAAGGRATAVGRATTARG